MTEEQISFAVNFSNLMQREFPKESRIVREIMQREWALQQLDESEKKRQHLEKKLHALENTSEPQPEKAIQE